MRTENLPSTVIAEEFGLLTPNEAPSVEDARAYREYRHRALEAGRKPQPAGRLRKIGKDALALTAAAAASAGLLVVAAVKLDAAADPKSPSDPGQQVINANTHPSLAIQMERNGVGLPSQPAPLEGSGSSESANPAH